MCIRDRSMVSDTEAIVDWADFSLLVIRQDYSYEKDIINSINIMNDSNSKFLGCVLNDYKVIKIKDKHSMFKILEEREVEVYDR